MAQGAPQYFIKQRHMGIPRYARDFSHLSYVNPHAPKGGTLSVAASKRAELSGSQGFLGLDTTHEHYVFAQLMRAPFDDISAAYPYIAQAVEVKEDGTGVTFYLDPKAQFHDGSMITADDIIFTCQLFKKEGPPQIKIMLDQLKDIDKKAQHEVAFVFTRPNYDLPFYIAQLPILSKRHTERYQLNMLRKNGAFLGSGPYKMAQYDPKKFIQFDRVSLWWGADLPINRGLYNFDHVRVLYFSYTQSGFEAFKKGTLDWWKEERMSNWFQGYQFKAAQEGRIIRKSYAKPFFHGLTGLFINTRRPPLKDIRVRQALNLMFNFQWINQSLFFNQYLRNKSIFMNTGYGASRAMTRTEKQLASELGIPLHKLSDMPKATFSRTEKGFSSLQKKHILDLLASAGWHLKNGVLCNLEGQPLSIKILVFAPGHKKIFKNYVQTLQSFGIEADLSGGEVSTYIRLLRAFDYDLVLHFHPHVSVPGFEQELFWGSENCETPGTLNLAGVRDTHIDKLVRRISQARQIKTLRPLTSLLDRLIGLGYYVIPGWAPQYGYVAYWRRICSKGDSASLYSTDALWAAP